MHKTIAQSRCQMFGPCKFVLTAIVVVGTLFCISASAGSLPSQDERLVLMPDSMHCCLPLDLDVALAGNFGELRSGHFHAGLDFKTQGSTGHPVRAFADGYVCRVGVNAYGYGLVVYVRHPQYGLTSVYGHLSAFNDSIAVHVRRKLVQMEANNSPQVAFLPDELPVSMGDVIAKSGNTGSSGGPHVHFELRDCNDADDTYYNPLLCFGQSVVDHKAPRAQNVYVYPLGGVVDGKAFRRSAAVTVVGQASQNRCTARTFTAWGRLGFGIKAYDYMDGQNNRFGVYAVRLFIDDSLVYCCQIDSFRYTERRYINSLTDFAEWTNHRGMIMRSFVEPGNRLCIIGHTKQGDGIVTINEERPYRVRYELFDWHGNYSTVNFVVKGQRTSLSSTGPLWSSLPSGTLTDVGYLVRYGHPFRLDTAGCRFELHPAQLYGDVLVPFSCSAKTSAATGTSAPTTPATASRATTAAATSKILQSDTYLSPIYTIGRKDIPVHAPFPLAIRVSEAYASDSALARQLYIRNLDSGYVGGQYKDGALHATTLSFGRFAVCRDSIAPSISVVRMGWRSAQISVTDKGSGLAGYKVYIDGQFVPFPMNRYGRMLGHPSDYGIVRGRHTVVIRAEDNCGNKSVLETIVLF